MLNGQCFMNFVFQKDHITFANHLTQSLNACFNQGKRGNFMMLHSEYSLIIIILEFFTLRCCVIFVEDQFTLLNLSKGFGQYLLFPYYSGPHNYESTKNLVSILAGFWSMYMQLKKKKINKKCNTYMLHGIIFHNLYIEFYVIGNISGTKFFFLSFLFLLSFCLFILYIISVWNPW